ncbi:MAG: heme biosynthesis protein HemY [Proteobacteria bacterium]|nr:heme biosynthesis protein HemY [Pseudomonadota bacterium]
MLRALRFFVVLALLVAAAVWLVENPGSVTVFWRGYRIDAPVGIVVGAGAVLIVVVAALARVWRALVRAPAEFRQWRGEARRRKGFAALGAGMVAVAAGDAARARKLAGRAEVLLGDPPLTLLLTAQAAQLEGDDATAERSFRAMLARPETAFLGLRGLLAQAMRRGAFEEARELAERASRMHPEAAWAGRTLFDLEVRTRRWAAALATLERLARHRLWSAPEARRRRAVLLHLRGLELGLAGEARAALRALGEAHELAPDFTPAAGELARRLAAAGRGRKAAAVIERAWAMAPHPDLLAAYVALGRDEEPLRRIKTVERLTARNPEHAESRLALARAHLAAGLWGVAREQLLAAAEGAPTARVFRLLAELEERENGDAAAARRWLLRAAEADADPAWLCESCGALAPAWEGLCGHCQSFDSFRWRSRPRTIALAASATPVGGAALPGPAAGGGETVATP